MPRGGKKDPRETFTNDTVRFRNHSPNRKVPAPPRGSEELLFRNETVYKKNSQGIETPLGGFGASASPGFTWGKPGKVDQGSYFWNDSVESNKTGRIIQFDRPVLRRVLVTAKAINTDLGAGVECIIAVTSHNGDQDGEAEEVVVVLGTGPDDFVEKVAEVNIPIPSGKQLAVKVKNGNATDAVIGVLLDGLY